MALRVGRFSCLPMAAASLATAAAAQGATTYPQPLPASFSPTSGPPGTVITITGSGFTGLRQVWIGNAHDATVYVVNDGKVTVIVPEDATTAHLGLINPQHSDFTATNFTVTKASNSGSTPVTPSPPTGPAAAVTTITGSVTGAPSAVVRLNGETSRSASLAPSGAYSFAAVAAGDYTLTPSAPGHVFIPASIATTVATTAVSGANFAASASSTPTYRLSGTVSGAAVGTAVKITLNGANVGSAGIDHGGTYSFSGLLAGTYTVSAYLPGETFSKARVVTLGSTDSIENNFSSAPTSGDTIIKLTALDPLPAAALGRPYSTSVLQSVSGGRGAYRYQTGPFASGYPPVGMILNDNGTLSGTPRAAGHYAFEICAADEAGDTTVCAPTAITVDATVTAPTPSPAPTPPPAPAPPSVSGTSWVYYNGVFDWPGDYSFVASANYADTSGGPLSGPQDIKVTLQGAYGGWLPYAKNWNFNSAGYTKLTFALKPTVNNQTWSVFFVKVGDVPVGIYLDVSKYGPAPVRGQWATYTVPLADLGVRGTSIYKFCIQDQTGLSTNEWYVDNVGFVP